MNCVEATQLLLEADPTELHGEDRTPLSLHLQTCSRCRTAAEHVLEQEGNLREFFTAVRPRTPADIALQRVSWQTRQRSRRRLWLGLAPALAAAGLAGILLVGNGGLTTPETSELSAAPPDFRQPLVEAAQGQQGAVFETDNPNIVVVWSF